MKPFNSFGIAERLALSQLGFAAYDGEPLSGYLAGKERGGKQVCALEDAWAATFKVKHAIAVNSATSGLLAAAFAVGLTAGKYFSVSPMTMSATAAAPMFTGAEPIFCDVDDDDFGIGIFDLPYDCPVFATNLFGHPAKLARLRRWCDLNHTYLIEDNAQAPFAMETGKFTGTIGHIGVFSLNIHKPIQCGEGGVVVTDDDGLATSIRNFINHGENIGDQIGLNLRMPELCAAVALAQLRRGAEIVKGKIEQAEAILAAIGDIPGLRRPVIREGCTHSFYTIPFRLDLRAGTADSDVNAIGIIARHRGVFCGRLRDSGIPIVDRYVKPLYRLLAFKDYHRDCPVAEALHNDRLFYFENCAWDLDKADITRIGDAFKRAAEKWL